MCPVKAGKYRPLYPSLGKPKDKKFLNRVDRFNKRKRKLAVKPLVRFTKFCQSKFKT